MWHDPDGNEVTRTFAKKVDADDFADDMEADVRRGDYVDPKAGKVRFGALGARWLKSVDVDPSTKIRYEAAWRLHVEPQFGRRHTAAIKPSEIKELVADLSDRFGPSTAMSARLVIQGVMSLAVLDGAIKVNPVTGKTVPVPKRSDSNIVVWPDEVVQAIIDAHPEELRAVPVTMVSTGMREGEVFALAAEDIDENEGVIRIRRQIKKLGNSYVYALSKSDKERIVPLPAWTAAVLRVHMAHNPPTPVTLPWERPTGRRGRTGCSSCGPIASPYERARTPRPYGSPHSSRRA